MEEILDAAFDGRNRVPVVLDGKFVVEDFQFCTDLPDRTPISHHQRVKVVGIFNEFFRRTDIQLVLKIEFLIDIIFHRI